MAREVVRGDTLNKIAAEAGITLAELLELNPQFRDNPDLIHPGDMVTLPGDEPADAAPDEGAAEDGAEGPEGGAGEDAGLSLEILHSESMRWFRDKKSGLFYVEYQLPGGGSSALFEAEPEQIEALFGTLRPPEFQDFDFNRRVGRPNVHFAGNVAEVEGSGEWEVEVERVLTLALDQRDLPQWIKDDPKALDALWVAVTEERTDDWFFDQISGLPSFRKRYPGVKALEERGLTVPQAIKAHTEFEFKARSLHAAAGLSPEAVTPEIVGNLLTNGYSINDVQESYSVWKRLNDHAPALEAFNQVLQASGQKPLTGTDLYKFLQGNAPQEIYDLYEASSITEAAEAAGLGGLFEADDALSLALETNRDLTLDEAFKGMQQAASQALRFRHELNLGQFGLDVDELIDVSFGRAPRSGRTASEVGQVLARITQQAEGFLGEKAAPFFGFTPSGRPQARSFGELRQESI